MYYMLLFFECWPTLALLFHATDLMVEFMISHMAKNFRLDLYRLFHHSYMYIYMYVSNVASMSMGVVPGDAWVLFIGCCATRSDVRSDSATAGKSSGLVCAYCIVIAGQIPFLKIVFSLRTAESSEVLCCQ